MVGRYIYIYIYIIYIYIYVYIYIYIYIYIYTYTYRYILLSIFFFGGGRLYGAYGAASTERLLGASMGSLISGIYGVPEHES